MSASFSSTGASLSPLGLSYTSSHRGWGGTERKDLEKVSLSSGFPTKKGFRCALERRHTPTHTHAHWRALEHNIRLAALEHTYLIIDKLTHFFYSASG